MTVNRWTSLIVGLGMAASFSTAVPADAQRVYTSVRVGDPYVGSSLDFDVAPRMAMIPNTRVYYVNDNNFSGDLYRVGGYWYYVDNGNWYRASSWRGPFLNIEQSNVPTDVYQIPSRYRMSWTSNTGRRYETTYSRVGDYYEGTALSFRVQPAMGRIPGWVLQCQEQYKDNILIRPLLEYTGPMDVPYVPIANRE